MKHLKIYSLFILAITIYSCKSEVKEVPKAEENTRERMELIDSKVSVNTSTNIKSKNTPYFVLASSGLIVRDAPSANSNRIGKLPYGSIVQLLETTKIAHQITNNGEVINGFWVKVNFENFPFMVLEVKDYVGKGYVFSPFIEKLNKATINTKEIDSLSFYKLYKTPKPNNRIKITSKKEAEKLLTSKVKWIDHEYYGRVIDEIILDNGQKLRINQESKDYTFRAYYPTEGVILFEGGHTSDYSISVKTGESLETVGNPNYIIDSPNGKLRLNGWFPGQECSVYFLQEKTGNTYNYLVDINFGDDDFGSDLCYFNKFCWLNNQEFMYSYTAPSNNGQNSYERYVIGNINNTVEENTTPKDFKSLLRPNEKIELGKIYKDTLKFVTIDDNYDNKFLTVEKKSDSIPLVYNKESKLFVRGDELEIQWKMDSIRYAGDESVLDFREFLVSVKKVKTLKLVDKTIKFLWREDLYNEASGVTYNSMILNEDYIKTINEPEKAVLAYVATFVGNECNWDGKVNENRTNLKCKIPTALNIGNQCSPEHLGFLRQWFRSNETILDQLKKCRVKPDGATIQNTFNEISLEVKGNIITVFFKASGYNMRESANWNWTEKHYFQFKENELILVRKEITPREEQLSLMKKELINRTKFEGNSDEYVKALKDFLIADWESKKRSEAYNDSEIGRIFIKDNELVVNDSNDTFLAVYNFNTIEVANTKASNIVISITNSGGGEGGNVAIQEYYLLTLNSSGNFDVVLADQKIIQ